MCIDFDGGIRLNDLKHTAGERVNSTIIQCVHEQILTGICIFPVFCLLPYKSLTKTKNTQSLKPMKH